MTNANDNTTSVISDSTNKAIATVRVGYSPIGIAYDPASGEIFVANYYGTTVSIISDSTRASTWAIVQPEWPMTLRGARSS